MKRWIAVCAAVCAVVCAVVLAVGPVVKAQTAASAEVDAAKQAKVQELFDAMHMDRTMEQMMTTINGMIEQTVQTTPGVNQMTEQQRALIKDFTDKAMKLSHDALSWKSLEPEYVKIYGAEYTTEEIEAITAFYKSPAGQTMLSKTPELMQASMKVVQARMVELQPQLKALQADFVAKMTATTGKQGASPSSTTAPH
jgi:hypothetical protein